MAKRKRSRFTESAGAEAEQNIWLEAGLSTDAEAPEGKVWDITIIGGPEKLVQVQGEWFVRSTNNRLYSVQALAKSAPDWENVRVYDNHQTTEQFEASRGMRSVNQEWLGSITDVRWDDVRKALVGRFKVVKEELMRTLRNAHEQGVLKTIGLSINAFPESTRSAQLEGAIMPVVDGFKKILSVDLVGNPAAGGSVDRIIAADQNIFSEESKMDKEELAALMAETMKAELEPINSRLEALETPPASEAEKDEDVEDAQALPESSEADSEDEADDAQDETEAVPSTENEAMTDELGKIAVARSELAVETRLLQSKLSDDAKGVIRLATKGRIVESKDIEKLIKAQTEVAAKKDPTGVVQEAGGGKVGVIIDEADKKAMMIMHKLMGPRAFYGLEHNDNDLVASPIREAKPYKSWVNGGKPDVDFGGRVSELLRTAFLGGHWGLDEVPYQEALTLATVIKNTVNIMTALDYAGANRWYEDIVDVVETDNPIDTLTMARLMGADALDVVAKGAAYTEMQLNDEEETAAHVKQGNYVAVNLEDLLADKIDYFRTLPQRLSDAWYNTLSAKVAAVFTTNTAAGPVLSTTGALFNSTAVTSAGGHANLLTTALSWTAYDAVIQAMRSQTARLLGTGRQLVDMGPFTILVPIELESTAYKIANSELQPEADMDAPVGGQSANRYGPAGGAFRPNIVTVPDWTDANDWAALARYRGNSPIKLAFPRGQLTPQVIVANNEAAGTLFTNDTIRYKLRMLTYRFSATYDCAPVADFRLLHKSNVT